jgi:lipopolysaccharide export system protein LptA
MKRFCLLALAALGGLAAHAQTNTSGTLSLPRGPTLITSASAEFDLSGHEAIYYGHVRVDDPQMKLACERLVADVPLSGGHVNHIVAETNVVIDFLDNRGHTNHASGDKAVYVYSEQGGTTNETVTLTGNPQMENADGTLTGDVIVWDRWNNRLTASNQKMIFRQSFSGTAATNAAATATNPPAINKTNFPPGTIQNIDIILQ